MEKNNRGKYKSSRNAFNITENIAVNSQKSKKEALRDLCFDNSKNKIEICKELSKKKQKEIKKFLENFYIKGVDFQKLIDVNGHIDILEYSRDAKEKGLKEQKYVDVNEMIFALPGIKKKIFEEANTNPKNEQKKQGIILDLEIINKLLSLGFPLSSEKFKEFEGKIEENIIAEGYDILKRYQGNKIERHKAKLAEILSINVCQTFFGDKYVAIPSSKYDDIKNKVDFSLCPLENNLIAIGLDVTTIRKGDRVISKHKRFLKSPQQDQVLKHGIKYKDGRLEKNANIEKIGFYVIIKTKWLNLYIERTNNGESTTELERNIFIKICEDIKKRYSEIRKKEADLKKEKETLREELANSGYSKALINKSYIKLIIVKERALELKQTEEECLNLKEWVEKANPFLSFINEKLEALSNRPAA